MKLLKAFLLCFICAVNLQAQMVEHTYDFNDLSIGDINGQDNWTTVVNSTGEIEMVVDYTLQGAVAPDGTLAAFYAQSAGNVGRTASRTTQTNFPFNFATGGIAEIEIDMYTAWWGDFFGFGYDANDNGYLIPAIETVVNCEANEGGIGFHMGNQSEGLNLFMMPDGSMVPFPSIFQPEHTEWRSYKIFVDFTANSGAGSVSFFVKEIGGTWTPVTEIQELNLGLTPGTGTRTDPATWTKLFMHSTGALGAFDNIILRQPEGGLIYQYLTFDDIPDHLTSDSPFALEASSNVPGLDVQFAVTSGPATISGNTVTLTGEPGFVTITASQPGNDTVAAAANVTSTFEVVDPTTVIPEIEIKNPVASATIKAPNLDKIMVFFKSTIEHDDILSVESVEFSIGGETIDAEATSNGYYVGFWTPPSSGEYTITATATSDWGVESSDNVTFSVGQDAPSETYTVINQLHFEDVAGVLDTTINMPSFAGTYSSVRVLINYECPPEGCNEYDVGTSCKVRGANGQWIELVRYITPFGVACNDEVDITDLVSQIQGKIDFDISFPEMSLVTITIAYDEGTPEYKYSWVDNIWQGTYPFGNPVNQQPVEIINYNFPENAQEAHMRLVSSGHGWGDNNTSNAAEFYEATHNIKLNGNIEFTQHLWEACNPNPVGCQPQNGTWYHNRAGWCPGSIPLVFNFDFTPNIGSSNLPIMYEFYPDYVDFCHPQNPDCITGTTCPDCNNTENPNIWVAGVMVSFSNNPIWNKTKQESFDKLNFFRLEISPNPNNGEFWLSNGGATIRDNVNVKIHDLSGAIVKQFDWDGHKVRLNLSSLNKGIYFLSVESMNGGQTKKIIIY